MDKVDKILNRAKIREFDDRTIAYLEKGDFFTLWKLKEEKIISLIKEGLSKKEAQRTAFRDKFKIINPLPSPVKVLHFGYAPGYSLVRDKEKILQKHLDKDWAIWVNKMRKNARILAKEAKDENEKQRIIDKFESQIKEAEKYYEMIKKDEVDEVIRTDFKFVNELYKPFVFIKYIDSTPKNKKIYLRKGIMNVIYEDDIVIPKKPKIKIEKELNKMKNVFGYYYVKEKK